MRVRRLFFRILLTGLSLALALAFAEGATAIFLPQNLSGSWLINSVNGLTLNRSEGTVQHQLGDRTVEYHFYPPHLRETKLPVKGRKILVLGDSFTFGWLLPAEETYVALLQEKMNGIWEEEPLTLLNAACGGWGAGDYLAYLEDFGLEIRPDLVLVFLNTDDIGRSLKKKIYTQSDSAEGGLIRHSQTVSRSKQVLNCLPGYGFLLEHSHLAQVVRKVLLGGSLRESGLSRLSTAGVMKGGGLVQGPSSVGFGGTRDEAVRLGAALFQRMTEWCRLHSIPLLVVTTGWHPLPEEYSGEEPTAVFLQEAPRFFAELKVPFADISPEVRRRRRLSPESYVIPGDHHPDAAGSRMIADILWESFLRDELLRQLPPHKRKTAN